MSANDRQEGGNHYKQVNAPQHWDLVVAYQWDYFQSQITKYLMRWKSKHPTNEKKLEDLKKARHFLDKYIENYEKFLVMLNMRLHRVEHLQKRKKRKSWQIWTRF